MMRRFNRLKNVPGFFRKNPRYVFVAAVLMLAASLNSITDESSVEKEPVQKDELYIEQTTFAKKVHIDGGHSTQVYDNVMDARKGDWYRIGFSAKSIERQDETLRVIARSEFGQEKEVGTVSIANDGKSRYVDFVMNADDAYRDVVIRKDGSDLIDKWEGGGGVELDDFSVSRLPSFSEEQSKKLKPTVFGSPDVVSMSIPRQGEGDSLAFPTGSHFIFGQTFSVPENRYLLSVTMNMRYASTDISGRYRLELYAYDKNTKWLSGDTLKRNPFSLKDAQRQTDENGYVTLDFPVALEKDMTYFLGISDSQISGAKKGALQILDVTDNRSDEEGGSALLALARPFSSSEGQPLMSDTKIEDFGAFSRYAYAVNHAPSDLMDIYEASDKVTYDEETRAVVGDASPNIFFTYKIDTSKPFSALHMKATQLGNTKEQVRMEYSYDNASWTEVGFTQEDIRPQAFDAVLSSGEEQHSVAYFRVRYGGEKVGKGVFGLHDFRVIAEIPSVDVIR